MLGLFLQLPIPKQTGPDCRLLPDYFPLLAGILELLAPLANGRMGSW